MGGGGKDAQAPSAPAKTAVVTPSGYTSWDQGQTWQADPNTHFTYGDQAYFVESGKDVNDQANWLPDTMAGYHMSTGEYESREATRSYLEQQMAAYDSLGATMQSMVDAQRKAFEQAEADRAATAAKTAEEQARRRKLMTKGRGNVLTSGLGDTSQAQTLKATLGE